MMASKESSKDSSELPPPAASCSAVPIAVLPSNARDARGVAKDAGARVDNDALVAERGDDSSSAVPYTPSPTEW